jgi:hypothetical protein
MPALMVTALLTELRSQITPRNDRSEQGGATVGTRCSVTWSVHATVSARQALEGAMKHDGTNGICPLPEHRIAHRCAG